MVTIPSKMQADLVFTRLKYLSEGPDGRPDVVVHSCSGRVGPGSSMCILSGSHDRTADILLRVLGGRTSNIGTILGGLTVNDAPLVSVLLSILSVVQKLCFILQPCFS